MKNYKVGYFQSKLDDLLKNKSVKISCQIAEEIIAYLVENNILFETSFIPGETGITEVKIICP